MLLSQFLLRPSIVTLSREQQHAISLLVFIYCYVEIKIGLIHGLICHLSPRPANHRETMLLTVSANSQGELELRFFPCEAVVAVPCPCSNNTEQQCMV
jgi:hypothetical protein